MYSSKISVHRLWHPKNNGVAYNIFAVPVSPFSIWFYYNHFTNRTSKGVQPQKRTLVNINKKRMYSGKRWHLQDSWKACSNALVRTVQDTSMSGELLQEAKAGMTGLTLPFSTLHFGRWVLCLLLISQVLSVIQVPYIQLVRMGEMNYSKMHQGM